MMPAAYHQDVRTTLTLDDDVAAKLRAAARRSGRPFREVVNDTLRRGLMTDRPGKRSPFRVRTRSLGGLRPGLSLDNISDLLDQVEGPLHR
ncbi:ribbon-helix-helix domain-containing protein [soil metagenome]